MEANIQCPGVGPGVEASTKVEALAEHELPPRFSRGLRPPPKWRALAKPPLPLPGQVWGAHLRLKELDFNGSKVSGVVRLKPPLWWWPAPPG